MEFHQGITLYEGAEEGLKKCTEINKNKNSRGASGGGGDGSGEIRLAGVAVSRRRQEMIIFRARADKVSRRTSSIGTRLVCGPSIRVDPYSGLGLQ